MLNDNLDNQLIVGDENNNNLIGTSEDNIIKGLEGDDTLSGNAGNDSLDGGNGNNTLYGGVGDDTLVNNFGYVDGESGNNILIANYFDYEDSISNIAWRSNIRNSDDDNLISLYSIENYQIIGTAFDDSLQGSGNDSLDGGESTDKLNLDFSIETEPIIIDFTTVDNQVTFENTEVKNFEEIGSIYGGSNDDIITLGLAASTSGGYVYGLHGNDTLVLDYSSYETAIKNIDWSSRVQRIDNNVNLIYYDDIQQYQITGTEFDDSLQGGSNSDTLIGGAGDDEIYGNGNDILDGGEGTDKLSLDFSIETEPILIDLSTTDHQVTFENTEVKNFEAIGSIYGGSNDDIITLGLAASISGGYVYGLHGNDTLILDYSSYETAIENIDWSSRVQRIDNNVNLIYYDDIQQYQITGTEFDDSLQGGSNSDTLIGGAGDDSIIGNSGEDIITGVNPNLENAGIGEIDTLVGGADSDYFLLGDANQIFYDDNESSSQGREDYALIQYFDLTEDKIELSGSKDNYRLGFSPITDITGTAIYRVGDSDEADELIAIIEDVTQLNINSDVFSSIANSIDDDATEDVENEGEVISELENEEEVEVISEPDDIEEEVEIIPEPDDIEEEVVEIINEPDDIEEEVVEIISEPDDIEEEVVEIISEPDNIEEEVETIPEPEDVEVSQLNSYQISCLVVGLNTNFDSFTEIELNTLADINRDGIISAFDAYLAYSTFDEV